MGVLNVLQACEISGGNTGFGNCFVDIKFIKGIYFVPNDFVLTTASIMAAQTQLAAAILADVKSERVYPVNGIVNITVTVGDLVEQKFNDQSIAVVAENYNDWTFQFVQGGMCLNIALRLANGLNRKFYLYDKAGKLYGTTANAAVETLLPFTPALAWTPPFKPNDGTKTAEYATRVNFEPTQMNEYLGYVDFSANGGLGYLQSITGLQNVVLSKVSRVTNVLKVAAVTACGTVNLYALYSTDLDVTTAWIVTDATTGKVVGLTSVALDPTTNSWILTVNTADANYVAGNPLNVSLVGPTELATAGMVGYESNTVLVTP